MKRIMLIAILGFISIAGCHRYERTEITKIEDGYSIAVKGMPQSYTMRVFKIDDCEYLATNLSSNTAVLAHKGNCKSCREFQASLFRSRP